MGIYQNKKGRWGAQYFDEHGVRKRQLVGTEKQAQRFFTKRTEEVRMARLFPEERRAEDRRVTVAQLTERYWPIFARKRSHSDDARYRKVWDRELGSKLASDVRASDVERYRTRRLEAGKSPATINRAVAFLRRVFNLTEKDRLGLLNPLDEIQDFEENNERIRWLTDEERAALEKHALPHHWELMEVAFHTGLRQAEQTDMRREDVDLVNEVATIPRSKHGKARYVQLNSRVVEIIKKQLEGHQSEWVWPGRKPGTHIIGQTLVHAMERTVRLSGIVDLHWHDLRHDFCSQLVMAGKDIRTVQVLAGHKTLSQTLRYAHLAPQHLRAAVECLVRKTAQDDNQLDSSREVDGLENVQKITDAIYLALRAGVDGGAITDAAAASAFRAASKALLFKEEDKPIFD